MPPVAITLLASLAALLAALGDDAGALGTGRCTLAVGVLWTLDLIALVVALGLKVLESTHHEALWQHDLTDVEAEGPLEE